MIRKYLSSHDSGEILRFCVVGFSNFLVSFSIYYLVYRYAHITDFLQRDAGALLHKVFEALNRLNIETFDGAFANICGYSVGILNSFIWNKTWTFDVKHQTGKQFKRFIIWNLFCLVISTLGIFVFVDVLKGPYKLVWFLVGIVTILFNYFGYKYWVFKTSNGD